MRDTITRSIETAVYREETVIDVRQRRRCKNIRFLLGTRVHHAEFGVIEHHCATTGNDIHIPFNVAICHQCTRLAIGFQTVLHTAVGDKEGILTTENIDVIDLHFIAIGTQRHRRMITRIYAIAQGVFDGQILQLQTIVLRPEDRRTQYTDTVAAFALAAIVHIPRWFTWHIFAAWVDVVTPVGRTHSTIKGKPNFDINRFFTRTVQSDSTRSCRNVNRAFILTWQHGNILALIGVLDNCRIHRSLNGRVRHTLCARRSNNKVRLCGQGNR